MRWQRAGRPPDKTALCVSQLFRPLLLRSWAWKRARGGGGRRERREIWSCVCVCLGGACRVWTIMLPLSGPHANSCMVINGTWSTVWGSKPGYCLPIASPHQPTLHTHIHTHCHTNRYPLIDLGRATGRFQHLSLAGLWWRVNTPKPFLTHWVWSSQQHRHKPVWPTLIEKETWGLLRAWKINELILTCIWLFSLKVIVAWTWTLLYPSIDDRWAPALK